MKMLAPDARRLPVQHLTIRVPWHDGGWAGTVCQRPPENRMSLRRGFRFTTVGAAERLV